MTRIAALGAGALALAGCDIERVACCENPAVLMGNTCVGGEAECNLIRVERDLEQARAMREALFAPGTSFSCVQEVVPGESAPAGDCRQQLLQSNNAIIAELERARRWALEHANGPDH